FSRKEESLQEGLYKHIVGLLNRVKSNIQIVNPLKETVKKNYGDIYVAIKRFAPTIEALIGNELSEDEIAFLTIHFSTSVSAINQDLHYVYKAVVICNHGIATGKLLSENLKELFNIEVLAVLSSKELQVIEKLDVDLVFSTVAIDYQEKPVIELEPIIKEESKRRIESFLTKNQDLKRLINNSSDSTQMFYSLIEIIEKSEGKVNGTIYKELEALFDKNHLTMNKKEIQPMLEDVLTSNNILLNEEVETWEESIVRVSEPLLKNQVIEPSYVSAMIDSVKEFGPYIVIGKHLALAHARPEDGVNKLGISVATTKKPIAFGNEENDPVKIIFCLAAVDSYSHLNIMKSLIELINDADKIERLSQETDVERFQEILFS
ncbi:MAG: PTS sugar transporter subunit IIA, partial [Enterococcus sp.]|nr:PTS sugar transporter subunit IIA [Enterococcus sp.]